jgi:WbqC-like protein family
MKKVAILQSNYIPWKGYFDMIASVDEFVIFDDMQYTRRDWRNRNQLKTPHGVQWLTVPVLVKGKYYQKIRDTEIDGEEWASHHWKALTQNYSRSRYFSDISRWLEPIYLDEKFSHISKLNRRLIEAICSYLKITTKITNSWDYHLSDGKSSRLANICMQAGATQYLSGPSARDYIDESVFNANNIEVAWFDYSGYSEYPQLWGNFVHGVTVLDVMFNCGPEAAQLIRRSPE